MIQGRIRPLIALAIVALLGAGCSDGSASGDSGDQNSRRAKAMKFSACMRDNGVGEFPDPDASGELTLDGVVNGSSLDTSSAAWKDAIAACRDLQPAGFTGRKASPEEQDTRLEFARCMRDNGVEDFPDPAPDGPLIDTTRIPSAAGRGALDIPGFTEATEACLEVYDGKRGPR